MFRNREQAGEALATKLEKYKSDRTVVLAVPRGAIIMGEIIARHLHAHLDVVLARKVGTPFNPELAVGAVSEDGDVYLNEWAINRRITENDLRDQIDYALNTLRGQRLFYSETRSSLSLSGRPVIIVDDGIATGATVIAAAKYAKKHGARRIIVATAVMPAENLEKVKSSCDELVVLEIPKRFRSVGEHFENFSQISDADVLDRLKASEDVPKRPG